MNAVFSWAVKYKVTAECCSPLRIGGNEKNVETVAIDAKSGKPYIPATSIAGPFKAYASKCAISKEMLSVLGTSELESNVIFGDGQFYDDEYILDSRPRVRINKTTSTAVDGGKFDVAMVESGSRFYFELVGKGNNDTVKNVQKVIRKSLAALNSGEILIGGQKTSGFGKVTLVKVEEKLYDMHNSSDMNDWLDDAGKFNTLDLNEVTADALDDVVFSIKAKFNSVFVKSQLGNENIMSNGKPVIPGSSLKGVFRNRCESIGEYLGVESVALENIFGIAAEGTDEDSKGKAGHVYFDDAVIEAAKTSDISRIRINKISGGVMNHALLSESVPAGETEMRIAVRSLAPDSEAIACGLILYAVRDLAVGRFSIGGNTSIGRGRAIINSVKIQSGNCSEKFSFDAKGNMKADGKSMSMVEDWLKVLGGCR